MGNCGGRALGTTERLRLHERDATSSPLGWTARKASFDTAMILDRTTYDPGTHLTRWLAPPRKKLPYDETISGVRKGDNPVGDKGGKKDKSKSQKQMAERRDQKAKEKRDKQKPSTS